MLAGSLIRRFGILKTILAGTLLSSVGYLASSFTASIYNLYITYGALPGLGLVMISMSSLIAIGRHFHKNQALAMGICQAGGSVGGFIFNPLLHALIQAYGWRGAVLILSGILMHAALFALIIHTLEKPKNDTNTKHVTTPTSGNLKKKQKEPDEEIPFISIKAKCPAKEFDSIKQSVETLHVDKDVIEETCLIKEHMDDKANANFEQVNQDRMKNPFDLHSDPVEHEHIVHKRSCEKKDSECTFGKLLTVVHQIIPYKVFGHRPTCIVLISSHIRSFGFYVPFVLLPDLAVERGISIGKAAWLVSGAGIAGAVSRVVLGWISGLRYVDRLYLYSSCILIGGVLTAVCPLLKLYSMLLVYACMFGWLMGGEVALTPVICSDVAGKDKLPETYGMLRTVCGIGALCGTPLSGWLFEVTGGYTVPFILSGALITVSGFLLLPLKCQRSDNKNKFDKH